MVAKSKKYAIMRCYWIKVFIHFLRQNKNVLFGRYLRLFFAKLYQPQVRLAGQNNLQPFQHAEGIF